MSLPTIDQGNEGGGAITPELHAERFMTEFSQNVAIFRSALMPWLSGITQAITLVNEHEATVNYLNGYVGTLRTRVNTLESRANDLEAEQQEPMHRPDQTEEGLSNGQSRTDQLIGLND